ncbi:MAG: hypothetical protein OXL37_04525 [Chloroflexota bacterium]|nr:hypothetical protein [Chloroflexota bacterium]MDE2960976.1 hypothetical protein [Chloroflexota bacterium]
MALPIPPSGEPDIYEALANALLEASRAHLEASGYFEAALPRLRQARELDDQCQILREESLAMVNRSADLMLEVGSLARADLQGNIAQALALMSDVKEIDRRARALSAGASALLWQASGEAEQGLSIWREGTDALRIGLERAATLLQEASNHQANGDNPDPPSA